MSLQMSIEAYLDDAEARRAQAELEAKNLEIQQGIEENEKRTKEAFDESMNAMRASYMIITGVTQAVGGSMSQAFSAMYGVAVAGIGAYQSIAAAMAAVPGGQIQAALMTSSLIAAIVQLAGVLSGQEKLSRSVNRINSALHGIGMMIGSYYS